MNEAKKQAIDTMNELHRTIPYSDYCTVMDGLQDIETLRDRDEELEELWAQFGDIPMNPETECIEEKFMGWEPGTHREEIWRWFDERHSKNVHFLLYGEEVGLRSSCFDCETTDCAYNHGGECRFSLVHYRVPVITDEDGCKDMAVTVAEKLDKPWFWNKNPPQMKIFGGTHEGTD